jgi:allantoinase
VAGSIDVPADRTPRQMDNPYTDWSPLPAREPLNWPDGKRLAVCVIVTLEHFEWPPHEGAIVPPSAVKFSASPHEASHHEYGNRVGVFRVMNALDRHGIRATAAVDAALADQNAFLMDQCKQRNWEFIGHGVTYTQMITEGMSENEERAYIATALNSVAEVAGSRPVGWVGADYGESTRTVGLLAELGVRYVCDWPNDEQPYRMTVQSGEMVSLPVTLPLDTRFTLREGNASAQTWVRMVEDTVDCLLEEGSESGRLLVLNLHPYLIGQPFRVKYLERALASIMRHRDAIWFATGTEIVDWYLSQS